MSTVSTLSFSKMSRIFPPAATFRRARFFSLIKGTNYGSPEQNLSRRMRLNSFFMRAGADGKIPWQDADFYFF